MSVVFTSFVVYAQAILHFGQYFSDACRITSDFFLQAMSKGCRFAHLVRPSPVLPNALMYQAFRFLEIAASEPHLQSDLTIWAAVLISSISSLTRFSHVFGRTTSCLKVYRLTNTLPASTPIRNRTTLLQLVSLLMRCVPTILCSYYITLRRAFQLIGSRAFFAGVCVSAAMQVGEASPPNSSVYPTYPIRFEVAALHQS